MTNKYSNGLIYKICCKDPEIPDCYIGSTCNFSSRKSRHRSVCKNDSDKNYNLPIYQFIRDNGGFQNWTFILIEKYPTETKEDLLFRERYWTEQMKPSLNRITPIVTTLEWKQYFQQKYLDNKDQVIERNKTYRENNREEYLLKGKEYYKQNKEIILQKNKIRYENNKEEILKKQRDYGKRRDVLDRKIVKIECDICGKLISKCNMTKHKRVKHS